MGAKTQRTDINSGCVKVGKGGFYSVLCGCLEHGAFSRVLSLKLCTCTPSDHNFCISARQKHHSLLKYCSHPNVPPSPQAIYHII